LGKNDFSEKINLCVKSNKNLTFDVPFFLEMGKINESLRKVLEGGKGG